MAGNPEFIGLHFWVKDMQRTLAFYRAAGFDLEVSDQDFVDIELPGGLKAAFGTDTLTRRYDPAFQPPSRERRAAVLQFRLESREAVDALYARLIGAGYTGHLAPIDAFWGARYAEVLDPDGTPVGFHSPRG